MNTQITLAEARKQTDKLFDMVRPSSIYDRPIPERHRIIFYLGHLEAFDWNLLRPHMSGVQSFDASLDRLFAFGIDPVDGGLPSDKPADWPSVETVRKYKQRTRETIDAARHDSELLHVALEHRLMHAETLAYMLHQLPLESKMLKGQTDAAGHGEARQESIDIPAGRATLGSTRDVMFGWDNEFDAHTADVPAFAIDRYKVSNGEFLRFLESGAYQDRRFWSDDAWQWKSEQGIGHPVFWKRSASGWFYRTMFDEVPLPLDWPVYVSHAEASAYARWRGARLPLEQEWHRAAFAAPDGSERRYPWGDEAPGPLHGYFDFARWDPAPVNAFPAARSAFGVEGLVGNGWEWTASTFAPFAGFAARPFYPGYSADFFDGKHYVLKGGSSRTAGCMLRRSFRNWFQPHYQYVYAGFRCAGDAGARA